MTNRDALRDLQSRLAQRLDATRGDAPQASWLAIECGATGLLVPLAQAGEIFPLGSVAPVPHTQRWFVGVANLRGELHGVVDLAAFLGLRAEPGAPAPSRLLALNPTLAPHVALLFGRLAGLRSAAQLAPEPDDAAPRPAFAGSRWRDEGGRVWQEIDVAALARHEQFLGIARTA